MCIRDRLEGLKWGHVAGHKVKFIKSNQPIQTKERLKKSVFIKNRRPIQNPKYIIIQNGMSSTDLGLSFKLVKVHTNFTNHITMDMRMLPNEQRCKPCKGGERTKQDSMIRKFKCYETFYKPIRVEFKEGLGTLPHYIDKVILDWWTMESRERLDQVTRDFRSNSKKNGTSGPFEGLLDR